MNQKNSNDPSIYNLLNNISNVNELISNSTIQSLLSIILNSIMIKERELFLNHNPSSKNGFYNRKNFYINSIPIPISIPRTRDSSFFPSIIPKYSRVIPDDYKNLVEALILSSKSINYLKLTLSKLNLPFKPQQIDQIVNDLAQDFKAINSRELNPDWLFIFADAKNISIKNDKDQIRKGVMITAIGIDMNGYKHFLGSIVYLGNENLDAWRDLFENIVSRGVRRVLMVITDNFSGLEKLIKGFFPHCMRQLCIVHLIRNAKYRVNKDEYKRFREMIERIERADSYEEAQKIMDNIIEMVSERHKSFGKELTKDKEKYIEFVRFPKQIRTRIKSNNASENIHSEIEKIRLNTGGYFQSERILYAKVGIFIKRLEYEKWRKGEPKIKACLFELHKMFREVYGE